MLLALSALNKLNSAKENAVPLTAGFSLVGLELPIKEYQVLEFMHIWNDVFGSSLPLSLGISPTWRERCVLESITKGGMAVLYPGASYMSEWHPTVLSVLQSAWLINVRWFCLPKQYHILFQQGGMSGGMETKSGDILILFFRTIQLRKRRQLFAQ